MSAIAIAVNRFGLGGRPGEMPSGDPKRWLAGQFDAFDANPGPIAALAPTTDIATEVADYIEQVRMAKRGQDGAPPARRPGAARQRPGAAMSEEGAMGERAAMQDMQGGDAMKDEAEDDKDPVAQARRFGRQQARAHYMTAAAARIEVALNTPAPFVERLVHFWANHFAVSIDKFVIVGLAGKLEFDAIRPNVLGKFRDMLFAVERHPAMLIYLDQAQSIGPNSQAAQVGRRFNARQQGGLNENLAREIMELHTLGVRSVYSQADVTEFARAMTGWTINGFARGRRARFLNIDGKPGSFAFSDALHEPGARTILGKSWPQDGYRQAASVLDFLATHPATAKHIATKLARHFAGDDPPAALVARLEKTFLSSGGDLPSVYRVLIDAPECWVDRPVKFKTPWEWTVSALRALDVPKLPPQMTVNLQNELGQPLWKPGSPAGWDDNAASWAGPDAIMRRVETAERMASRTRDAVDARARAAELFPDALSPATAQAIARAESPGQGVALMLVAPEFMRR